MKNKYVLLTLSLLIFSLNAFSQSRICMNPLKTICGSENASRSNAKNKNIENLQYEIITEAKNNAKIKFQALAQKYPKDDINLSKSNLSTIYYKEIINSAKLRMRGVETIVLNSSIVEYLKTYMKVAIHESTLDPAAKKKFIKIVDKVIIGNFSDYVQRMKLSDSKLEKLNDGCGLDGMTVNAFSTKIDNQRYVLVCPGFQITMHQTPNMQDRINNILYVLSHEIAHHFDSGKVEITPYAPFIGCIYDNYAPYLNKSKKMEIFCSNNSLESCNIQNVLAHSGELIADLWAHKVLAIYARAMNLSIFQTDNLLKTGVNLICGSGDEGIHPSGDFRIGVMLRLSPEISNYLACDNYGIEVPACTLEGRVKLDSKKLRVPDLGQPKI